MKPLLAVIKDRQVVRTCDETCYNSGKSACTCICGGLNHGQGYGLAVLNSGVLILEQAAEALLRPEVERKIKFVCSDEVHQLIQRYLEPKPHVDP